MLEQVAEVIRKNTAIGCTGCRYCTTECPKQIAIPDYFGLYNNLKRLKNTAYMYNQKVYYSWSNGNTKRIAEHLAEGIGADITRIDTVQPYEGSYDEVVSQGQREVNKGYKPPIKPIDVDLSQYDGVAIGTPTWWYTMAPAVHTFLDKADLTGKTVIPFMTNGGWPGHVIKDMKKEVTKDE